jgi:hypothetical protein
MTGARCRHTQTVAGVLDCDLTSIRLETTLHSTQLLLKICKDCGEIELLCESLHDDRKVLNGYEKRTA